MEKERERAEAKEEAARLREEAKAEAARRRAQENLDAASAYIQRHREADEAAAERRATAAATPARPAAQAGQAAAAQPMRRALPESATSVEGAVGITSSPASFVSLLHAAARDVVEAYPRNESFRVALVPLLWHPGLVVSRHIDSEKLLAFAASCIAVLHEGYDVGRKYPPSKADDACAAFAGI